MESDDKVDLSLFRKVIEISDTNLFSLYAEEVYRDLCSREDSKKKLGMSRLTFYGYIKLPVLLADKLFNALDKNDDGYLNKKEFVEGLFMLYYGSFKQTAKIVFNMYDFDKDGYIKKEDIKILFSYLPLKNEELQNESLEEIDSILESIKINKQLDFAKFLETVEKVKSDIYLQMICYLYEHKPFAIENVEACKLLSKYKDYQAKILTEGTPDVYKYKNSIFEETLILSSPSKTSVFKPVDSLFKMIEIDDFNLNDEDDESAQVKLPILPTKLVNNSYKFTTQDLNQSEMVRMPNQREFKDEEVFATPTKFFRKGVEMDIEPFDLDGAGLDQLKVAFPSNQVIKKKSSVTIKSQELITKGSFIFKLTESNTFKPFFLLLCNKDIYYYKNEQCNELLGMHNLSGCYILEAKQSGMNIENRPLFSFSVVFANKTREYYSDSLEDAEHWVKCLKIAVGYLSFSDTYEMQSKTLGEGKFGLVKLGIHKKTGGKVAIKIIKKETMTTKDQELVKSEIDIMKICRNQNIVRLLDHFENSEYIYIVMEYLAGGTLAAYLENTPVDALTEKDASIITYQITKALEYLHQFGIIHRDLKPENIMIKDGLPYSSLSSLKIMDFGLSKILGNNERVTDGYGTLTYVAPEVLTRKPYNKHVDIWSLGVIVYYTLCGIFPFDDASNDEEVIAKKTVFQELKFSHKSWPMRSPSVKQFINSCMIKDMDKRATIQDLVKHKWFYDCEILKY